jgi:1,4-dihydroxy-2-naphthoyl-CoA hydrolase
VSRLTRAAWKADILALGHPVPRSLHLVNNTSDNPDGSALAPAASVGGRDQSRSASARGAGAAERSNSVAGPETAGQRSADRFGIDGVSGFMGMRWDTADTVRLEIRPELINAGGLLSGVVTYALVDYCMGSTLWPHTTEDEHIATLNISINYIQTATEGEIVCKTELDRRNRTNAVLHSEVRHEDGRLLVGAIGSYAIFPARKRSRVS